MDFEDTDDERAFRLEARAWLSAHAEPRTDWDSSGVGADGDRLEAVKTWQRTLFDGGWAGITWPTTFGGRGGTAVEQAVFQQEQANFAVAHGPLMVGLAMVGPTLIAHGTPPQQDRFLAPLLRGDEVWCQLFSEPEAGSDLAGLRTVAERDGDEYVVTGQKVWTSGAHVSDWGILLTRTDPAVAKHRGLTYFVVDMRSPGIEVRPLTQITGIAHFNEVFLDEVRIPVTQRIGEENDGWRVALTTLANERSAIGGGRAGAAWQALLDLARRTGATEDARTRQDLARAYSRFEILRYLGFRTQTARSQGLPPGPESSVIKLLMSRHAADLGDLVLELQGPAGMLDHEWSHQFLNQWGIRIGGGTDEVQRNVIGERTLGLPAEQRLDKGIAFRDIARSATSAR
jgi:acyl-CoA dehydrogenase